jgi:aryl-alcohol dehydrogenase-like predicted oxidoreductase
VIGALEQVAKGRSVTMAQVALAWLADRPAVTSVILGARTLEQLDDNLGSAGLHLTAEETELLTSASEPATPDYPYGGPGTAQRSRALPPPRS